MIEEVNLGKRTPEVCSSMNSNHTLEGTSSSKLVTISDDDLELLRMRTHISDTCALCSDSDNNDEDGNNTTTQGRIKEGAERALAPQGHPPIQALEKMTQNT